MYKKLFVAALSVAAIFSVYAKESLLYYSGFSDWNAQGAGESVVVDQTTDFTKENFSFTMYQTRVAPTMSANNGTTSGGALDEMTTGCLMAEKTYEGTVTISALKSITKVDFIHAATGNNRGWGLKVSVDGGTNWDIISDAAITTNARSGVKVSVDVTAKLDSLGKTVGSNGVMLQFYNLNSAQNAYLQDLWIYGEYVSAAEQVTLSIAKNIEEAGTVTAMPPSDSYDINTVVTLTAEAAFGYEFVNWTDATTGAELSKNATFELTLDANKSIVANFNKLELYTVTVNTSSRNGRYTISPALENGCLPAGTEVTVTAVDTRVSVFTGWDNGTTSKEMKFTLMENVALTANFADVDFIVGWDFNPQPTDRKGTAANYYSAAANKGMIKMYDLSGANVAWLNNARFNKNCILKWATDLAADNRYFEATFSTKGYEAVSIESLVLMGRYACYDTQTMQYSIDGVTYNDVASVSYAGTEAWHELNGTLPEECNDKETVYIRWISSGTVVGSGNDGTGLADIYVLATPIRENDPVAPAVIATTPAEGSNTASASGSITFTFDKNIKLVDGFTVTLNGEALTPRVAANSLIFNYSGLAYDTKYTVTIPAGMIANVSDVVTTADIVLAFTTMARPIPAAHTFHAIVDQSLVESVPATADAIGQYKTIWEAVEAAPADRTEPWLIFIKSGYYNDENGDAVVKAEMAKANKEYYYTDVASNALATTESSTPGSILYIYKPFIHLIGQDKESVIIAQDRVSGGDKTNPDKHWYDVSAGATLVVMANDFYAENLTIDNEWWTKNAAAGPQALALYVEADRVAFNNCNIRSYQDTYLSPKTQNRNDGNTAAAGANIYHYRDRNYFKNCFIEGAVDFIYGGGDVYFDGCTLNIVRDAGGYIVAPCHYDDLSSKTGETNCTRWGYVFKNTLITAPQQPTKVWFGRPWHNSPMTVFIDTECHVETYDGIWAEKMGGIPKLWAVYNMWNADGEQLNTTSREEYTIDGTTYVKAKNYLTDEEAAQYTLENVLAGDGSNNRAVGKWNPAPVVEKTTAPVISDPTFDDKGVMTVEWQGDQYAICYIVKLGDVVMDITTETSTQYAFSARSVASDMLSVQSVNEYGALSEAGTVKINYPTTVEKHQEETVAVFGANRKINVRGLSEETVIEVYDLAGCVVWSLVSSRNVSFDMPAGHYLVKVGGVATKVMVY